MMIRIRIKMKILMMISLIKVISLKMYIRIIGQEEEGIIIIIIGIIIIREIVIVVDYHDLI